MQTLDDFLSKTPFVPFVRESGFAVRKPWSVARRALLDYLLIYIQQGHCIIECNEIEYSMKQGDFCLIQPRDVVALHGITETITPFAHFDIFWNVRREESFPSPPGLMELSPHDDLVQPRLNDFDDVELPTKTVPSNVSWFRETFLRAIGQSQQRELCAQIETQNLLSELVLSLLKDAHKSESSTRIAVSARDLNWISSYILLHLNEPISVAEMASRAQLSPSRFAAVFRSQFGCAPHQYVLRLRLSHARQLLERSDQTVAQIAELTGFAGVHHFAKTWKKQCGGNAGRISKKSNPS